MEPRGFLPEGSSVRPKDDRDRLRFKIRKLKENGKCKYCPESHPATLQFHHRDPQKKQFNISRAIALGFSESRVMNEISKCDLVCSNCHLKAHWKDKR